MRTSARHAVVVCVVALALSGCTADPAEPDDPAPDTPTADATTDPEPTGPSPDEVVATSTLVLGGTEVTADVYPVVRAGEHAVLTLDLATPAGTEPVLLGPPLGAESPVPLPALTGVRLVDLQADDVYTVAVDADGATVTTGESFVSVTPDGLRLQIAYAAPPAESLGLFLPGGPFLAEVPVVDGDIPAPDAAATGPIALDAVAQAPVHSLASYTRELAGAVSTLTTTEQVEITLGSDVLFDIDSAELTADAQGALDAAVVHLEGREPGTITVIGHTDDVAGDAHNQDLSERRAESVAAALGERIDTSAYPIETEGRGESEPLVANSSDENRALNRRVTLKLTSTVTTETDVTTTGELPELEDGPVATGAEGVEIDCVGTCLVAAPEARRVDGHLVVDLDFTPQEQPRGPAMLSGVWHHRGDSTWSAGSTASGVTLLVGGTAVYPLDYQAGLSDDGQHELWLPLTDLHTKAEVAVGQTRTLSIVYPDVGDLDEIAIQVDAGLGSQSFRLTDIPVG